MECKFIPFGILNSIYKYIIDWIPKVNPGLVEDLVYWFSQEGIKDDEPNITFLMSISFGSRATTSGDDISTTYRRKTIQADGVQTYHMNHIIYIVLYHSPTYSSPPLPYRTGTQMDVEY